MNHSFLVIQGAKTQRRKRILEIIAEFSENQKFNFDSCPDILNFEGKTSVSINQMRNLKKLAQRKPYFLSKKFALILEAEKLTLPAQNSLLKLLEEPPPNTIIILSCQNEALLLPTVVSRCQIIKITPKEKTDAGSFSESFTVLKKIILGKVKGRFEKAEILSKDRETATKFLNDSILIFRELIRQNLAIKTPLPAQEDLKNLSTAQLLAQIKSFQKTKELVKKNVNTRLALEALFLNIPNIITLNQGNFSKK
jgi:DNA polymerase-3 subunit delta'